MTTPAVAAVVARGAVALPIALLVLSVLCDGCAAAPPFLCVLPIGDSLTQGVNRVGSYRSHLHSMLTQSAAESNASVAGHRFVGVRDFHGSGKSPYVVKYLADKGNADAAAPHAAFKQMHMGRSAWTSTEILNGFRWATSTVTEENVSSFRDSDAPQWKSLYRESMRSCKEAALNATGRPPLIAALLLFGHNDGLRNTIKRCSLVQDVMPQNDIQRRCVDENMQEFRSNIPAMLSALEAEFVLHQRLSLVVLVGLNPPLYFPTVDVLLHQHLRKEVPAWHARYKAAAKGSGEPSVDVSLVEFRGWQRQYTVDSVHPEHRGCRLMAEAWLQALAARVAPGSPPSKHGDIASDSVNGISPVLPVVLWLVALMTAVTALRRCVCVRWRQHNGVSSRRRQ